VGLSPGSSTRGADVVSAMKRVGWRDRGRPGIPGEVADHGAVAALGDMTWWAVVARVVACGIGGAGGILGVRAEERRENNLRSGFSWNDRAQWKVFEKTCDLAGDLLEAKTRALHMFGWKIL
jgi:hypothetical protein